MDRRIVFFLVFVITLTSTLLVAAVCVLTQQPALETALFTLATMWIMGIVSQLLLQNLYQAIAKPLEEERKEEKRQESQGELGLEEIEEIDQATPIDPEDLVLENITAPSGPQDAPTVGVHLEQKG